jgi:hypothetical protein
MGQEYSLEKLIQQREYEVAATWQQRGSNVAATWQGGHRKLTKERAANWFLTILSSDLENSTHNHRILSQKSRVTGAAGLSGSPPR